MPARKSPQKKYRAKRPSDSPIKVGGGGGRRKNGRLVPFFMELEFDHARYIPHPEDQNSHENPTLVLDKLFIIVNNVPTEVPVRENDEIEIKYKRIGSFNPKIAINGEDAFGVDFKPDHLRYDYGTGKHYGAGCELDKLKVDGKNVPLPTTRPIYIEAHTKSSTRRRKKTR